MSTTSPTTGSKPTSLLSQTPDSTLSPNPTKPPHHEANSTTHNDQNQNQDGDEEEDDADALFATLESEDLTPYTSARATELAASQKPSTSASLVPGSATPYLTLTSDDEVLRFTTSTDRTVLHFFHADFARCATMDDHLRKLAEVRSVGDADPDVRFARVDVKDAAFVVEKLGVRVLPCVIAFVDGVGVGRVVGFEGLGVWAGGREEGVRVTRALEERLVELKVCGRRVLGIGVGEGSEDEEDVEEEEEEQRRKRGMGGRAIKQGGRNGGNEDDDEEWD